jgi:hypothetical protein
MALQIDLECRRCPAGYRIGSQAEAGRVCGIPVDSLSDDRDRIIAISEDRIAYRPFDQNHALCIVYSKIKTPEELLSFVQMHGSISDDYLGDRIKDCISMARTFRELLSLKKKGQRQIASHYMAYQAANLRRGGWDVELPADYSVRMLGSLDLAADPVRGLYLKIDAGGGLWSGLWMQLAQKLSGSIIINVCRHCGGIFEAGPGTGKHVDAAFCCEEHKIRFYSLARSKPSKSRKKGGR